MKRMLSKSEELCFFLRKRLPLKLAIDIQQYLQVEVIASNKIGISFTKDLQLLPEQKELLRECLHLVYGANTAIVRLQKVSSRKTNQVTTPFIISSPVLSVSQKAEKEMTQWQKAREHLVSIYGEVLVDITFNKLDITETSNQITFTGSSTFTELAEGKFGSQLDWLAQEYSLRFVFVGKSRAFNKSIVSEIGK